MDQNKWRSERVGYVSKETPGRDSNPNEYMRGYFLDTVSGATVKVTKLFLAFFNLFNVFFRKFHYIFRIFTGLP